MGRLKNWKNNLQENPTIAFYEGVVFHVSRFCHYKLPMKFPSPSQLWQSLRSPAVLTFILMSLIGFASVYALGYLTGQLLRRELLSAPVSFQGRIPEKLPLPNDVGRKKEEFAVILARNIFQAQRQQKPLEPLLNPDAPRLLSTLNLALKGTVVVKNPQDSYAFLAHGEFNLEKVFGVGECFLVQGLTAQQECSPESIKLTQVFNRRVAFLHNGTEEWLVMPSPEPTILELMSFEHLPVPEAVSATKAVANLSQLRPLPTQKPPAKIQPIAAVKQESFSQTSAVPLASGQDTFHLQREWVDEQLANFAKILQDARVVPIRLDEQVFFQFKHIKAGSMYETLGLKNKDVILSINDILIDNLSKAMGLLEKLQSEREIALVIKREEGEKTLRYYIN